MKITDFLNPKAILPALSGASKAEVLSELAALVATHSGAPEAIDPIVLRQALWEREELGSTAIGDGVAIPHAKLDCVSRLVGFLARSVLGVEFGEAGGHPTTIFFVLVVPASSTGVHLQALGRLSRLFREAEVRQGLRAAADSAALYRAIVQADSKL